MPIPQSMPDVGVIWRKLARGRDNLRDRRGPLLVVRGWGGAGEDISLISCRSLGFQGGVAPGHEREIVAGLS